MFQSFTEFAEKIGAYALENLMPAVIIAVAGILLVQLLMKMVKKFLEKSKLEKAAHSLIKSVLKVVCYVVLLLIIASRLGIDVTSIVALASVLTLAVSLALQNILANVIGGFTLLYTKPFSSGEFVEIAAQSGTVQEIGLTYTKMVTVDNKLVSVPNSAVTAAQIINYTALGHRRVEIPVSAAYSAPVEQVLTALRRAGDLPVNYTDPAPKAVVASYGDSAIFYKLFVWCDSGDYATSLFETTKNVKAVFDEMGIEMTYPHLNVHIDK